MGKHELEKAVLGLADGQGFLRRVGGLLTPPESSFPVRFKVRDPCKKSGRFLLKILPEEEVGRWRNG
jgi:hypothetical protein